MAETTPGITTRETRTPAVHIDSEGFHPQDADGQWRRVTEAIRQDLSTRPQTRAVFASFVALPLSESLPKQAIDSVVAVDERVRRLTNRYHDKLGKLLDLPPVPDDQLVPDITNARRLQTVGDLKRLIESFGYKEGSPQFEEHLQRDIQQAEEYGRFAEGVTSQERKLVAQRYRFARDVKILALGAEILEQPAGSVNFDETGKVQLPSGVQIAVDTSQADQRADMLNPLLWQKRKQLKDRVYEIEISGRKYILKEKKTARHTDTKRHGHREGLSSEEEFATARYFHEHGTVEQGQIALRWEKPIGFVTYPDGFQFTVFEYEENLNTTEYWTGVTVDLTKQIIAHQKEFQTEYAAVKAAAQRYKDDIKIEFDEEEMYQGVDRSAKERLASVRAKLGRLVKRPLAVTTRDDIENLFTFEHFAGLKAIEMTQEAQEVYQTTLYKNNYTNSDRDGTAYRINTEDGIQLEIFGFDFEYFEKIPPGDAADSLAHSIKLTRESDWRLWNLRQGQRRIEKAAYRTMLAMSGRKPEGKIT